MAKRTGVITADWVVTPMTDSEDGFYYKVIPPADYDSGLDTGWDTKPTVCIAVKVYEGPSPEEGVDFPPPRGHEDYVKEPNGGAQGCASYSAP